jgi:serine/threonine-protein kinase
VDRAGTVRDMGADSGYYYSPQVSPDGRRVAMVRAPEFSFATRDIWVFDLQQRTQTRLTFDTTVGTPVWSPDGRRVAYPRPVGQSLESVQIAWVPADGSGPPVPLVTQAGRWRAGSFAGSGSEIVFFGRPAPQAKQQIWAQGTDSGAAPRQVLATTFENGAAAVSPNGRWMAYVSDESGRGEVYVRPYPGPGGRWQISLGGGSEPLWSSKGDELFYRNDDDVMAAALRTAPAFEVTGRTKLFSGEFDRGNFLDHNYSIMPDGQTFVMLRRVVNSRQALVVTLNWFDQFRGKK